jgi:pteridine reductase
MNWQGQHVLVTGAGKRLGRAIAEALLARPIRLTAHYHRSKPQAEELVARARARGSEAIALPADLGRVSELREMVRQAEARFGPIGILVNSASDFYPTPALDVTEAQWDHLLSVNLKGQFFLAQAAAHRMREKGGVILNLCDVNGTRPMKRYTPYAVSKAGLLMLTRNLAKEWAPEIRVNAISPGPVLLPESYTPEQREKARERTLLKRLGAPEDIAAAALFLIGNDYITGADLAVDGGRSLA